MGDARGSHVVGDRECAALAHHSPTESAAGSEASSAKRASDRTVEPVQHDTGPRDTSAECDTDTPGPPEPGQRDPDSRVHHTRRGRRLVDPPRSGVVEWHGHPHSVTHVNHRQRRFRIVRRAVSVRPLDKREVDSTVAEWIDVYGAPDADVAHLVCDRHDAEGVAFTFVTSDLSTFDMTYGELADRSRRLASALARRGVRPGDRVAVLMGKRPELVVTLLALWRLGAVHVPLFTAFATGAIQMRVEAAGIQLVVTEPSQAPKLNGINRIEVLETGADFDALVTESEPLEYNVAVGGDGAMLQLFTSGTTGKPKGVPVPVRALAAFHCYMHYSLDVRRDDVFWNAADPGWADGRFAPEPPARRRIHA